MGRYLLRQGVALVVLLLIASFVVFSLLFLTPGDPIAALIGTGQANEERIAQLRAEYHLDRPFLVQYGLWLGGVVRGDFGSSTVFQESVATVVGRALQVSVPLIVYAEVLVIVFSLAAAAVAARYPGTPDTIVALGSSVFIAVPTFVAAVVLSTVFSVQLGWFPNIGDGEGVLGRLYHLTLPAFSLAVVFSALLTRIARSAMRDELQSQHVDTEVARGIPFGRVFRRHVLRNSAPPQIATIALQVPALIAGTVVVEQAFNLGGIGSLLLSGVNSKDFPLVQAIALLIVFVTIVAATAADVVNALLDPRVRAGVQS